MKNQNLKSYRPILMDDYHTVVSNFVRKPRKNKPYQSEAQLEEEFIQQLVDQGYEHLAITSEQELLDNLRDRLESLNEMEFSAQEWKKFHQEVVANPREGVLEKTAKIQQVRVFCLQRDDGTSKNIRLVDDQNLHRNHLQVINQYTVNGRYQNRYDVTILINGLPLVHIELKRRGIALTEAFNQIKRYQRDSFLGTLYDYIQIFVVSNGTQTKYYSNSSRKVSLENSKGGKSTGIKSANFWSTFYWTERNNHHIEALEEFTGTFLSRQVILPMLLRYCVFDGQKNLLVLRPYQVAGVEAILNQIDIVENHNNWGKKQNGGYVWHTTGSGKTLTSFKTAQLASQKPNVDKVVFVVDRRDLDNQTMKEYNRFQAHAANSTATVKELKAGLKDPSKRIIVTTIQKLDIVSRQEKTTKNSQKIAFIFDECHRSQAGSMHQNIRKKFNRCCMFGFTGTPIFSEETDNAKDVLASTEELFGRQLHSYTIVDGIGDKNVLPFMVEYFGAVESEKKQGNKTGTKKVAVNFTSPERIRQTTEKIISSYAIKTRRNVTYMLSTQGKPGICRNDCWGFNGILATGSIEMARMYYQEFAKQQANSTKERRLKVGVIFSWQANEKDRLDAFEDGEIGCDEIGPSDVSSRDFMEGAIADYNQEFGMAFDTSSVGFQGYYSDVSEKMKNKELDLLIVVNMFLTGFDAKTLNTIWIDKPLNLHGVIQVMSRTNRVFSDLKIHGNVICLRDMRLVIDRALLKYGNKEAKNIAILKPYEKYLADYKQAIGEIVKDFSLDTNPIGERSSKRFIELFGKALEYKNILATWEKFTEKRAEKIISPQDFADYQSRYIDLRAQYNKRIKAGTATKEEQETEFKLDLLMEVEINVDYIMDLLKAKLDNPEQPQQKLISTDDILKLIKASPSLRSGFYLWEKLINSGKGTKAFPDIIAQEYDVELSQVIRKYSLVDGKARKFMREALVSGEVIRIGPKPSELFKRRNRFGQVANGGGDYQHNKNEMLNAMEEILDKFRGFGEIQELSARKS